MRLALVLLLPVLAVAADGQPDPAAMQAAMAQMAATGPQHTELARLAGAWQVQSTLWMAPGAPPQTSTGSAVFTVVLGGRWVRQEYRGTMMGQPYEGVGMLGFDGLAQRFVATWHDNASTMQTAMTGESNDGGRTITYTSTLEHCPITGGPLAFRYVHAVETPDRLRFTMYQTPQGGAEHQAMEMVYTRAAR